ncbi:MAG: S8 family serine peptidase [Gemmatimonadota bacterium]
MTDEGVAFPRNIVMIGFQPTATHAQRKRAIASIGGVVVGGVPIGLEGMYVVKIKDDGTTAPLHTALADLRRTPGVRVAVEYFLENRK